MGSQAPIDPLDCASVQRLHTPGMHPLHRGLPKPLVRCRPTEGTGFAHALAMNCRPARKRSHVALVALALLACGQRRDLNATAPTRAATAGVTHPPWSTPAASTPVERSAKAGPVPDYGPVAAIVSHTRIDEMAPDLRPALAQILGGVHVVRSHTWTSLPDSPADPTDEDDDSTVWMRDYQPIYVRQPDGRIVAYRYLATNANRQAYHPPGLKTETLPIIHENGNLVVAGRYVFLSESVVHDNRQPWSLRHLLAQGYRPRTREDLQQLLARRFHRRPEEIVFVPAMPYEATGHVDLFLLPLDDQTIVVPRVVRVPSAPAVRASVAKVVQVFLDEQAEVLEALGLRVLRLPMIPPTVHDIEDFSREPRSIEEEFETVVYSPANSLLVNVQGNKRVFVPTFAQLALPPVDAPIAATYARSWAMAFAAEGWQPLLVDASELAGHLGLFRCVTASVPVP